MHSLWVIITEEFRLASTCKDVSVFEITDWKIYFIMLQRLSLNCQTWALGWAYQVNHSVTWFFSRKHNKVLFHRNDLLKEFGRVQFILDLYLVIIIESGHLQKFDTVRLVLVFRQSHRLWVNNSGLNPADSNFVEVLVQIL